MAKKHTIWNSEINTKDWLDEDGNEMEYDECVELNNNYLDDERMNLDVATDGEIILIADIGRWNGRITGYKMKGHRISNILYSEVNGVLVDSHWYSNGKDIVCDETHHDGINYYRYRVVKPGRDIDKLFEKPLTERRIAYYTKSLLPYVAEVYGWEMEGFVQLKNLKKGE